jgi:glucan phosphorylase
MGVPSLSILDAWWIEGCIEGVTGWAIDSTESVSGDRTLLDAISLYNKLEQVVIPLFYRIASASPTRCVTRSRLMVPSSAPSECFCNTS